MRLVLLLVLVVFVGIADATDYYVNNSWVGASDSNMGLSDTNTTAWLTVQKAANTMSAGDIVHVLSGTYDEAVTISSSGADGNLIVFQGEGRPLINKTAGAGTYVVSISGSWVNFTGFNISAKDSSSEAGNAGIRLASGSNNDTIHDNIIITDSGIGVSFSDGGGNYSTVSDNVIYTGYRHGIAARLGSWTHLTIKNNTIYADRYLQHKNNGNANGINVYSTPGKSTYINITYNKIYSSGYTAIKVGYGDKIGELNVSYNEMSENAYSHNCVELTSSDATYIGNYIYDINTSWVTELNSYYGASSELDQNMTFRDNRLANSSGSGRGFTVGGHQRNIFCENLTITNFSQEAVENLGYDWGMIETSANITYVNTTVEMNSGGSYPLKILQMGTYNGGWEYDDQTFIDLSVTGTYPSNTYWITDFQQCYGTAHFINANKDDTYISSSSGNFDCGAIFYYYADVKVVDSGGSPINGATVVFECNDSSMSAKNRNYTYVEYPGTTQNISMTTTGSDGHTPKPRSDGSNTVAIVDFKHELSGKTYYNWTLNVSKSGYDTNNTVIIDVDSTWFRTLNGIDAYQNTTTIILSGGVPWSPSNQGIYWNSTDQIEITTKTDGTNIFSRVPTQSDNNVTTSFKMAVTTI